MKVSTEKLEGSRVALAVEAPEAVVQDSLQKAFRSAVRRVTIPGFRKGKAPRSVFERHYGKENLAKEAMEDVLPEQFRQAAEKAGIEPVDEPEFDDIVFEEGKPLQFTAKVAVMPEVQIADYSDLAVPFETPETSSEEIDKQVELLRGRLSELRPLDEGTVLEPGMFVTCHVKGVEGADQVAEVDQDFTYIEVGKEIALVPGLDEALVGMKVGETKEFTGEYPSKAVDTDEKPEGAEAEGQDEAPEETPEPQEAVTARFTVSVKGVYEKHTPDDEEFLQSLGKGSLEEVREDVEKNLREAKLDRAVNEHLRQVEMKVLEKATLEIPQVMIDRKAEDLVNRFAERLAQAGIPFERYLESIGRPLEDVFKEFQVDAEREVRVTLVLNKAAELEGTEVSEESLDKVVEAIAKETGQDAAAVKTTLDIRGALDGIKQDIARVEVLRNIAKAAAERAGTPIPEAVFQEEKKEPEDPQVEGETQEQSQEEKPE